MRLEDKFQDFIKEQNSIIEQFRSKRAKVPKHDYQTAMNIEAEMMGLLQDFTFLYIDNLFFNKKDYRTTVEFYCYLSDDEVPNFDEMSDKEIFELAEWCVKHI